MRWLSEESGCTLISTIIWRQRLDELGTPNLTAKRNLRVVIESWRNFSLSVGGCCPSNTTE